MPRRALAEHQNSWLGGIVQFVPLDQLRENQAQSLQNAEIARTGAIRRRGGLRALITLHSALTLATSGTIATFSRVPHLLRSFKPHGAAPYLVGLFDFAPSLAATENQLGSDEVTDNVLWSDNATTVQLFDRLYTLNDGTAPKYWTPGAGVLATEGGGNIGMPSAKSAVYFRGRAWATGVPGREDLVFFSNVLGDTEGTAKAFQWNQQVNSFRLSTGRGVALSPFRNLALIAFTDNGIETLEPDPQNIYFTMRLVASNRIGCGAQHSIQEAGQDLIFVDQEGNIRSLSQTQLDETRGAESVPLSRPIDDVVRRITKTRLQTIRTAVFDQHYWIALPLDGEQYPTSVYGFSLTDRTWVGPYRFGFDPDGSDITPLVVHGLASHRFSGTEERLYLLTQVGVEGRIYQVYSTRQDDSTTIPVVLETRAFTWGEPRTEKTGVGIDLEARLLHAPGDTGTSITVEVRDNEQDWKSVGTLTMNPDAGPALPVSLAFTLSPYSRQRLKESLQNRLKGYQGQFRLTVRDSTNDFEILRLVATAIADPYDFRESGDVS